MLFVAAWRYLEIITLSKVIRKRKTNTTWYHLHMESKIQLKWTYLWNRNRFTDKGRRQWQLTPVLLPGKSHGQRSLVGCSPWGHEESDTTEWLPFHTLEKEMATHSNVLAWRIPGMGKPGWLPSMGSHGVGHSWSDLAAAAAAAASLQTVYSVGVASKATVAVSYM